jgi:hypothetical protein
MLFYEQFRDLFLYYSFIMDKRKFIILLNKAVIDKNNVSLSRLKQKNYIFNETKIFSTVSFCKGIAHLDHTAD